MSNKIGRFEILSEINSSPTGSIYKANDPDSSQTVALKTLKLDLFGENAAAVVQSIQEEGEKSRSLNSHNIALLYGTGEADGQFWASMEYVQGNSIATMLARKEGFSIWDLMDIARQTSQGLDHAHVHQVVHYSLEPAKIAVQWDGTVKILGFGVSMMGAHAAQATGAAPDILHYMPPEQLSGDQLDSRSNLFSLGAILYEMVTERKAFEGDDADQVRQAILERTPVAPDQVNRKIHPALSDVIMKALSKSPDDRYSSGQDLVNDLERCKESATKTVAKKAAPAAPAKPAAPAASQPKPAAPVVAKPVAPTVKAPVVAAKTPAAKVAPPQAKEESVPAFEVAPPPAEEPVRDWKAAAAAAGWSGDAAASTASPRKTPKLDPSAQFISNCVKASVDALSTEQETMSAAIVEPEVETPKIAVDPMMAEGGPAASKSRSFSEIDELPPLKEAYVAPPPPPPTAPEPVRPVEQRKTLFEGAGLEEKPKVQPREVAKKAVKEIKKTPPKLFMYSIAAAVGFILLVVIGIAFHIHNENADEDTAPVPAEATATQAAKPSPAPAAQDTPAPAPAQEIAADTPPAQSPVSVTPKYSKTKKQPRSQAAAPSIIPGQLTINSTPEGAQVTIDGRNDPSWVTPYVMTGLNPGQHNVSVNRAGYSTETRTIDVASGSKSFLVVQLAQLASLVSITSEPAGASVVVDGKETGRLTPTQVSLDKPGSHSFTVRKQGYLEESTTVNLQSGQSFHFGPSLRALGSTDEIKTVNKFKKVFGGGGGDAANMGVVSIKTSPKGAQIAINQRIVDKASPVEFYLNPGTYVLDITSSGYKSVHRIINVDKGGKVAVDETLVRE